ncbi:MAG: Rnf-Nqr domain containing protein [Acutalibacteraceae bacterium]
MPEKKRAVLTPKRIFTHGVIVKNPVLVQVIGLCPAVAAAADLLSAALLSAILIVLMVLCECIASLFLKKVSRSVRVGIYFLIGLSVCVGCTYLLEQNLPEMLNLVGIYLPLMAASSAVALRSENFAVKKSVRLSFLDALANGIGTALVLMLCGAVRELLGSGTLLEQKVFVTAPLRGLAMPFGGFIVLGFMAAILKRFISGRLTQYDAEMAFGIEKRKKKKPAQPAVRESAASAQTEQKQEPSLPAAEPTQKAAQESDDTGESHAADFYEQASEDPEEDLGDVLFDAADLSVQEELDAILDKIGSFEDILAAAKEEDNA